MRKIIGCMLLSVLILPPAFAEERRAPQLVPEAPNSQSNVPIALQHPHPEALTQQEVVVREPDALKPETNPNSLISHDIDTPNFKEYVDAVQKGDKTSAKINEKSPSEVQED